MKTVLESHSDICGVDEETCFFHRMDYAGFQHPDVDVQRFVRETSSVTELFDRFAEVVKARTGAAYFLEKTSEHALRLSYFAEHFPRSTFVFLVRDPRDELRSAMEYLGYWSSLPDQDRTGGYLKTWRRSIEAYEAHADVSSVLPLQYEDFCCRPQEELRRILDALGLEIESQQLDPSIYGRNHDGKVAGHDRLQGPITPKSVGTWREELDRAEARRVEQTLGEEMRSFGYCPELADGQ